jgi:glycine/D-amino acid oxidase-like deaminating enzyme
MLPIIGRDEGCDHILYAAGHSRNGILMAGLTGEIVAGLSVGESPAYDLSQFRPGRF